MLTKRRSSDGFGARPVMSLRQEKAGLFPLRQKLKRVGDGDEGGPQIFELRFSPADALDRLRQGAKNAAQRRVGGKRAEKRLGLDQLGGVAAHLVDREEEDAVPCEKLAAIGSPDGADHLRARRKVVHQRIRRLIGGFRRRAVDDGDDEVGPLGERLDRA